MERTEAYIHSQVEILDRIDEIHAAAKGLPIADSASFTPSRGLVELLGHMAAELGLIRDRLLALNELHRSEQTARY
jgi:hypothetical protein